MSSIRHHVGLMAAPAFLAPALSCMAAPGKPRRKFGRKQDQPAAGALLDHVDETTPADTLITYQAGARYLADQLYIQALATANPAATLDDIADAIPKTMARVFKAMATDPEFAAALLPVVTVLVWAYNAIEYARAEAGDGYGYLFDYLAAALRNGADPHLIRRDALAAPARIRELAEQAGDDQ
ncbi:hypothetical protein [Streptomyces brasiliscabiei]|uniref:hypothetical protein n=1 Tax=Streptomyces brasiliscabiei TaxID=2736302 RepID=UPI001C11538A|nr:hypothetical protein [Streptomyces brasiliscabiei]